MSLTTEELKKNFKSNFELARYAIAFGKYEMKAGRDVSIESILKMVLRHPNPRYLEDLKAIDEMDEDE